MNYSNWRLGASAEVREAVPIQPNTAEYGGLPVESRGLLSHARLPAAGATSMYARHGADLSSDEPRLWIRREDRFTISAQRSSPRTAVLSGRPTSMSSSVMRRRSLQIIAQDPSVGRDGKVLTARISLPWEDLEKGPMGYAVYVVDYDATARAMYQPAPVPGKEVKAPETLAALLND